MTWVANIVYFVAAIMYSPIALYNALVLGKNRRGWRERFGWVTQRDPRRKRLWLHAVSLGEVNATPRLVEELSRRDPDCEIVISTTTDTGFARAVQLYGRERVFRFPLDFSLVMSRVLSRIAPTAIVLVELEVWYNLVHLAARRGIPVVVANGRLTERSARRLKMLGRFGQSMFSRLAWVGAQDAAIADRFVELGVEGNRVEVTSSLKWDSLSIGATIDGAAELSAALGIDDSIALWVCGSTGPGEETLILESYERLIAEWSGVERDVPGMQAAGVDRCCPMLAIVPRKPERFDEVARLIERRGFECVRRSEYQGGIPSPALSRDVVILGDTMGELRKFYSLARVVFVGRTLVPMGGSDPMEVAALGKPIVAGPHTENFSMPMASLVEAQAVTVVTSPTDLSQAVGRYLQGKDFANEVGQRAAEVVRINRGATMRTADAIAHALHDGRPDALNSEGSHKVNPMSVR